MPTDLLTRPHSLPLFVSQSVRDFRTTGALAPSSSTLASEMSAALRERTGPLTVLEVGAGTGPFTRAMLPLLTPGASLDVVECNPRFVPLLSTILQQAPEGVRTRLHQTHVEQFETDRSYDVIVSGLPFTNFTPDLVRLIMDRYLQLLRPSGELTYFSYLASAVARALTGSPVDTKRHRAVENVLADYRRTHGRDRNLIWSNLPPATVHRLQAPDSR